MTGRDQYPQRANFSANRLIRLMQKSCAANSIGIESCWLVTCIALVEDSKRYSGPVTFWSAQLLPIAGFQSWGRLDRARAKAVEAGWLYYRPGTNRQCGVYWCLIPEAIQRAFNDSPVDEVNHHFGDHAEVNHQNGAHDGDRPVIETKLKRSAHGEPSIPVPVPIPKRVGASLSRTPNAKFTKPTAEEIRSYAIERGQPGFDSEKFIDYYESNGWRVGKSAMKDWRATVRNWIRGGGTQSTGKASGNAEAETAWQGVLDSLKKHSRFHQDKIMGDIGERAWQAVRTMGLKKIDEANDFDRREMRKRFIDEFQKQGAAA